LAGHLAGHLAEARVVVGARGRPERAETGVAERGGQFAASATAAAGGFGPTGDSATHAVGHSTTEPASGPAGQTDPALDAAGRGVHHAPAALTAGAARAKLGQQLEIDERILGRKAGHAAGHEIGLPVLPMRPLAQLHRRLQGAQLGIGQRQALDTLGVGEGEQQGDAGAVAVADQMGARDPQGVQQPAEILDHVGQAVPGGRHRACAMAAQVV
jgi:hypothetical protein